MERYPSIDLRDFLKLSGSFSAGFLRKFGRFDPQQVLIQWLQEVTERHQSQTVVLNFLNVKKILLVNDRNLSEHILEQPPSQESYIEGQFKKNSMAFLAPKALTISHGKSWQCLRPYNETVLCTGARHRYRDAFFDRVRRAFSVPISSPTAIRTCMGTAMLEIVFGEKVAPAHLIEDIEVLFGLVKNPLKRRLRGRREQKRREQFYSTLRQLWHKSRDRETASLLSLAQAVKPNLEEDALIQQIPHWMFTFTGSGTDLLVRTLALIAARAEVAKRVRREIEEAGNPDDPDTIAKLAYLEACLLETGRLYPPVTLTFHQAATGDVFNGIEIPQGMEILQVFPLMQRSQISESDGERFRPERWLETHDSEPYSNLFLRGARVCPGKDLILFVCKSAIARLLVQQQLPAANPSLARDPLPFFFPDRDISFHFQGT